MSRLYRVHRLAASIVAALAFAALAPTMSTELRAAPTTVPLGRVAGAVAGVDGIVIRGRVRARIAIGSPNVRLENVRPGELAISREGTTLTFERTRATDPHVPTVVVRVERLRGVATSGNVDLDVDVRGDRALFLDLAGTGVARVRGSVPLARTTTSGTVVADFSKLRALAIRVHARQRSKAFFATYERLTVVAVDDATVTYRGPSPDRVTRRNRATIRRVARPR